MIEQLLAKLCPQWAGLFEIAPPDPAFGSSYRLCANAARNRLVLEGDSLLGQAVGLRRYLEDYAGLHRAYSGAPFALLPGAAPQWPERPLEGRIPAKLRGCFSPLAFGNSPCWWDAGRWEDEVDCLALYGVNLPLLLIGSDAAWFRTLLEEGLTGDYILGAMSSPAYWPRQLMGQLDGSYALVDPAFLKARAALGRRIADRMRAWGMEPVVPGFPAVAPASFSGLLKQARLLPLPAWNGFACVRLLDPSCEAFVRLGSRYQAQLKKIYGECRYFWCDPLAQRELPGSLSPLLPKLGEALWRLFAAADRDAVWVQMADFSPEGINSALPENAVLFWGEGGGGRHPYLAALKDESNGHTVLHGDAKATVGLAFEAAHKRQAGLVYLLEEPENAPLMHTLRLEALTRESQEELDARLVRYAKNRYGGADAHDALALLCTSCYARSGAAAGSVFAMRPALRLAPTAPGNAAELPYDSALLCKAAALLLQKATRQKEVAPGLCYDLCDVLRQSLSNRAREYHAQAVQGYFDRDARLFERGSNAFLTLLEDCDRLVSTQESMTLPFQLKRARDCARMDAERNNFELAFLARHSVFGSAAGKAHEKYLLYDLCWREWGDLLGTLYLHRWRAFFLLLAEHFGDRRPLDFETKRRPFGRNEYYGNRWLRKMAAIEAAWLKSYQPSRQAEKEQLLPLAEELLKKYHTE
ncbi:MAG: alpha-N-acetylglucosaminidase [Oscillospiraceae bacterium]|jgi:alpha-N-acetylglucosaminidase|nr:alpha-N-acetylglucosaminidase [Oscillospiraceae bacterium]